MKVQIAGTILWDMEEIAAAFGLAVDTVRSHVRDGSLKARKVGRKYYSTETEVHLWAMGEYPTEFFPNARPPHRGH